MHWKKYGDKWEGYQLIHFLKTYAPYGILPQSDGDKVIDKSICTTKETKHIDIHTAYSRCRSVIVGTLVQDDIIYCIT